MTDYFRELCAELVDVATAHCHPDDDAVGYCAAVLARARAALAQPEPEGVTNYNEDFWRKDALEKLVYAAMSFRLGVYSAEELEIFENRARFFLARWDTPSIQPVFNSNSTTQGE